MADLNSGWTTGMELGMRMGQQRIENSRRMQELRSQEALRRVQERATVADLQMKLEEHQRDIDLQASLAKAGAEFQTLINPTNPAAINPGDALLLSYGKLARTPADIAGLATAGARLNELKAQQSQPTVSTITTPSGRNLEVFDPGQGRGVRQLVTSEPQVQTDEQGNQFYQSGPNRFTRIPPDPAVRQREARTHAFQASQLEFLEKNAPAKWAEVLRDAPRDPVTKLPIPTPQAIEAAAKNAGFQGATLTQMEQQSAGAEKVFRTGRRLLSLISNQTVGPMGAFNREVLGGIPGLPDTKGMSDSVAAESISKQFFGDISKAVRTDSNINEAEFQSIKSAAPDPTRFFTKPAAEKRRLLEFLVSARDMSRSNAAKRGKKITDMWLTDAEIKAKRDAGEITDAQAAQLWDDSATLLIEQLQSEIPR